MRTNGADRLVPQALAEKGSCVAAPVAGLTAEQRRAGIAMILAAGILRLRSRVALTAASGPLPSWEKPTESGGDCLELSGETVLSVHTG